LSTNFTDYHEFFISDNSWDSWQQKGKIMLTLYIEQTNNSIIISKEEFEQILEILRKNMDVKIIDDADYLTEAEMKIREEAMEELERGETISFEDWQKELREREKLELNTDV
jgi:hypothetical protein